MASLELIASTNCFGGQQQRYQHHSEVLNCDMKLSVFVPPQVQLSHRLPVLFWLSGLTCNDENFITKAGAQRVAAELGMILVAPDTSPRGDEVADDEGYDLGKGAGFYVNATQAPWDSHYKMYDYIVEELPALIRDTFHCKAKFSIAGHSMGGHGALVIGLSNVQQYMSVSAFAPIVNPMACDWGKKALTAYLGEDKTSWQQYDACHLLQQQGQFLQVPMLIDQGLADDFLDSQKLTRPFEQIAKQINYPAEINYHSGYDHSYYFIASFIENHLRFHYRHLMSQ
ncbi:S-formylglutathione hydrolase [Aliiglaciecola litoralis]|uniref:S-formylglutathione hydrolase n=1 Tax=Aliiglaciecola litoralis TaxID=582857 RepID=A0ABN1LJV6_9ALTE